MRKDIPGNYRQHLSARRTLPDANEISAYLTPRSLLVGSLLCTIIAIGAPYGRQIIKGTAMALTSATPAAFFLFFIFLLLVQPLLSACKQSWRLGHGELITVFIMMMVASAIPTKGVTGLLLPIITGTYYYASPENKWAELVHPHLPDWLVVKDLEAVRGFYEGTGGPIPWASWLPPLLAWLIFYASFYLTLICLGVLLRRQWVERERLTYPLAQVPLAMVEECGRPSRSSPFFKNWVMWMGFALPFFLSSLAALGPYLPQIGGLNLTATVPFLAPGVSLRFALNFLLLGLAYFISAGVSFSLWFFYLLHQIQESSIYHMGIRYADDLGRWTEVGMGHQMMGALIVLVSAILWRGRQHFASLLRHSWKRGELLDDSAEIMSYRQALVGFVAGLAGMWVWLWQSGIPAWIAPIFLGAGLIIFIGLARIIAETGLPIIKATMIPAGFVVSSVGVPALGVKGMLATGYTMVWCGDLLVFMMAPLTNALRLSDAVAGRRRLLFWGIVLAMLIALVLSVWYTIALAYRHGSVNLQLLQSYAEEPSRFAVAKLEDPTGPNLSGYLWMGGGGLIMTLLLWARTKLFWWPLHPLGFVVSHGRVMDGIWFTIFAAWLIKVLILKYGGVAAYRKISPFFLGMVLGQIAAGGCWLLIDGFAGTVGNRIPLYY